MSAQRLSEVFSPSSCQVPENLSLSYDEWFSPPLHESIDPEVSRAISYVDDSDIARHRFFELASKSRQALQLWASQELVVTNPFSIMLLDLASRIKNVHIRAIVSEVAFAEHGRVKRNLARHAHPWYLHELGKSLGLKQDDLTVLPETRDFLTEISDACSRSVVSASGVLGMGSERLLVPEYTAVKDAFHAAWPDSNYRRFLDANILEDVQHAEAMAWVGTYLLQSYTNRRGEFLEGAKVGVDARVTYYDRLMRTCETLG